jgi:hypothetical protein
MPGVSKSEWFLASMLSLKILLFLRQGLKRTNRLTSGAYLT